jgi:hypothetical protein
MWKRIKFYTVTAVIVALAALAAYYRLFPQREGVINRVVDAPALVKEIQRLNELVTVKYNIQKVIGLKEEKVPFGSESVLLMVQATVLGGVDLSTVNAQCVALAASNSVTISLPPPKIMHVFIDDKQTKVWDRSKTWWTPWVDFNPELEQKARLAALEAVQAAALDMGILSDAQRNTETTIREFLRPLGFESVNFSLMESK